MPSDRHQTTPLQRRRMAKTRRYLAGLRWWLAHSWRYRVAWSIRMRDFQ